MRGLHALSMNKKRNEQITIDTNAVTLRFGEMEPVVIPRSRVANRLRLIECVYRLTGWPGMNAGLLRAFISAVFNHHGWALPGPDTDPLLLPVATVGDLQVPAKTSAAPRRRTAHQDSMSRRNSPPPISQL